MDYMAAKPIDGPIVPKKQAAKRYYGSHPYFTKRAWNVVQEYIKTYTDKGDLVLDPYGGSGITAIESLVLGRKAIHIDIAPLANFITEQVAISPVNLSKFDKTFQDIKQQCDKRINDLYSLSDEEIEEMGIPYWYPKKVRLPKNADVEYVHELFTRRALIALSILNEHIRNIKDKVIRNLMLFVFSGTLAKVNRTFVSAVGRKESRGGATIFSVYRYYIPPDPVELNVWEQFEMRFKRIIIAKKETNEFIGKNYKPKKTITIKKESATRLSKFIKPESVDYIYTDPPYGAHIAYLDLTRMWDAWLKFKITTDDKNEEVIEGGDLDKTKEEYTNLLSKSINEMFKVLKQNRWLSIVFAHKDPAYWDTIVKSCQSAGFEYVNTSVQPVSVIWSMHKKKNPLKVLSGELVLNFRKVRNPKTIAITKLGTTVVQIIKNGAELTIVRNHGASTEQIYNDLIPKLLEAGILGQVRKELTDITPLLGEEFDFNEADRQWHIKPNTRLGCFIPLNDRIRFYVIDYLKSRERKGEKATFDDIIYNVMPMLINGEQPTNESILQVLEKVAHHLNKKYWVLGRADGQLEWDFSVAEPSTVPGLPAAKKPISHEEAIYRLVKMWLATGKPVHIGKKEQADSFNNEKFSDLSIDKVPFPANTDEFIKGKVENIDIIWFNEVGTPVYAFEIEKTSPITTAIDRFIELLKVEPAIAKRIVIVTPQNRTNKLNEILKKSHYIGHPLYMENKLVYLFTESLVGIYKLFINRKPNYIEIMDYLDKFVVKAVKE